MFVTATATPKPTPPPVTGGKTCSNDPTPYMLSNGLLCTDSSWYKNMKPGGKWCENNSRWKKNNYCAQSCSDAGQPYDGVKCAEVPGVETCTDLPTPYMLKNNYECNNPVWKRDMERKWCNKNSRWEKNGYCRQTCYDRGFGYPGDDCAGVAPPPAKAPKEACGNIRTPYMLAKNMYCEDPVWGGHMRSTWCNNNDRWKTEKYCRQSCHDWGFGYEGDDCTPDPPTNTCKDEATPYMKANGFTCADSQWRLNMATKWCNKNSRWAQAKYCAQTCYDRGFGYPGDVCSAPTPAGAQTCTDLPNSFMQKQNEDFCGHTRWIPKMKTQWCNKKNSWVNNLPAPLCQQTCYDYGVGYTGDKCGGVPPKSSSDLTCNDFRFSQGHCEVNFTKYTTPLGCLWNGSTCVDAASQGR